MDKKHLLDFSFEEMLSFCVFLGIKPFRASQIFQWIYKKGVFDFEQMLNLPQDLRCQLAKKAQADLPSLADHQISKDRTEKLLLSLPDGLRIETVMIPEGKRATVCVSTQAGCRFKCRFCASGIGGFQRNLTCAEILGQVLYVKHILKKDPTHIVFMGIGEPLDNYANLLKSIRILNDNKALNISARRITISTCGIVPKIFQLAKEKMQFELSVSLHGANDSVRGKLMPVNKKYPLTDLMHALRQYVKETKRQITFEYILIQKLTCTHKAVLELGELLRGLECKMNLIVYNEVPEYDYRSPRPDEVRAFKEKLKEQGIHNTVRKPRGKDIAAACGQLRNQKN